MVSKKDRKDKKKEKAAARVAAKTTEPENAGPTSDDGELFEIRLGHQDPRLDLKVTKINLAFGGQQLLKNSVMALAFGRRYGVVGKNGSGKSSLVKAIAKREFPGVPIDHDMMYLDQEVPDSDQTAVECVLEADWERQMLLKDEERIMNLPQLTDEDSRRLNDLYQRMEEISTESAPARACAILAGLQFTEEMQKMTTREFSGGWKMRLSLARALFRNPSMLVLDEPSNHLDLNASIWLENYLAQYPKCLVIISHDKEMLDVVCTNIYHIENEKLNEYPGNYTNFEKIREEKRREQQRKFEAQQMKKEHMLDVIQRTKGNSSTAGMASSRSKALDKMEFVDEVTTDREIEFIFPNPGELQHPVLRFIDVDFGYSPDKILYKDLDFGIDLKSRIGLVGPNGTGKSTLLKLFNGDLTENRGEVERNKFLRIATYSQHVQEELNKVHCSAIRYMIDQFPKRERVHGKTPEEAVRSHLGRFGLSGQLATKEVALLSGGQKARLVFAWIAWKEPHIVLLDEPTNHLDVHSIDALIEAIANFEGGIVVVSHNQYLIDEVCDRVWVCGRDQTVEEFDGNFTDYKKALIKEMDDNNILNMEAFDNLKID